METEQGFYICPTCFFVSEAHPELHKHEMLHYPGYPVGHEQLKPSVDGDGNLKTRAPGWISPRQLSISAANIKGDLQA
jgi:hypothetical protein